MSWKKSVKKFYFRKKSNNCWKWVAKGNVLKSSVKIPNENNKVTKFSNRQKSKYLYLRLTSSK